MEEKIIRTARKDDFWGQVTYIGVDKGIPETSKPPLGDWWDKKMSLSYSLAEAGGNAEVRRGVEKLNKRRINV